MPQTMEKLYRSVLNQLTFPITQAHKAKLNKYKTDLARNPDFQSVNAIMDILIAQTQALGIKTPASRTNRVLNFFGVKNTPLNHVLEAKSIEEAPISIISKGKHPLGQALALAEGIHHLKTKQQLTHLINQHVVVLLAKYINFVIRTVQFPIAPETLTALEPEDDKPSRIFAALETINTECSNFQIHINYVLELFQKNDLNHALQLVRDHLENTFQNKVFPTYFIPLKNRLALLKQHFATIIQKTEIDAGNKFTAFMLQLDFTNQLPEGWSLENQFKTTYDLQTLSIIKANTTYSQVNPILKVLANQALRRTQFTQLNGAINNITCLETRAKVYMLYQTYQTNAFGNYVEIVRQLSADATHLIFTPRDDQEFAALVRKDDFIRSQEILTNLQNKKSFASNFKHTLKLTDDISDSTLQNALKVIIKRSEAKFFKIFVSQIPDAFIDPRSLPQALEKFDRDIQLDQRFKLLENNLDIKHTISIIRDLQKTESGISERCQKNIGEITDSTLREKLGGLLHSYDRHINSVKSEAKPTWLPSLTRNSYGNMSGFQDNPTAQAKTIIRELQRELNGSERKFQRRASLFCCPYKLSGQATGIKQLKAAFEKINLTQLGTAKQCNDALKPLLEILQTRNKKSPTLFGVRADDTQAFYAEWIQKLTTTKNSLQQVRVDEVLSSSR